MYFLLERWISIAMLVYWRVDFFKKSRLIQESQGAGKTYHWFCWSFVGLDGFVCSGESNKNLPYK